MPNPKQNLIPRPPVVVIMGHIDHGKSTLLNYIRKICEKKDDENGREKSYELNEAGGITQHISAFEISCKIGAETRKMTFIDTPGHEAFGAIREYGARVADIAVLVVSAEDSVKPQTLEALKRINQTSTPFIVAINKIDKEGANVDKVKQNLAENNVLVEGWGGNIPVVAISAKTGENVSDLLEIISLQADLEELKGDPAASAQGIVIQAAVNAREGIEATLIIKEGTLKLGTFAYTNWAYAKVKAIENYEGKHLEEASFSSPVRIVGWTEVPDVGSRFQTFFTKSEAEDYAKNNPDTSAKIVPESNEDKKDGSSKILIRVVIKADTQGSQEAIEHEMAKISTEDMKIRVIAKGLGTITEQDIKSASVKKSFVLGFNVESEKSTDNLAQRSGIEIKKFNVIYDLIDFLKSKVDTELKNKNTVTITGKAKIIKVFSKNRDKQLVGGKVEEGEIKSGAQVKIIRDNEVIGDAKIRELQSQKVDVNSVKVGQDFGMMIESKTEIASGDYLQASTTNK